MPSDSEISSAVQKSHRTLQILAGAFILSALIYIAISWGLVLGGAIIPPRIDSIVPILALVALIAPLGGYLLRWILLSKVDESSEFQQRLSTFGRATIVFLASAELTAILGMVLSILCREVVWASTFGSIAIFAMIRRWPNRAEIEKFVSAKNQLTRDG